MAIEIFEIDFGIDGDLYFVTKRGNQIIIPNGELLFEKWCDRNRLSHIEREPESDDVDSMCIVYDKTPGLMKEFAMANKYRWQIEYDANGDFYGDAAEMQSVAYAKPL